MSDVLVNVIVELNKILCKLIKYEFKKRFVVVVNIGVYILEKVGLLSVFNLIRGCGIVVRYRVDLEY